MGVFHLLNYTNGTKTRKTSHFDIGHNNLGVSSWIYKLFLKKNNADQQA